MINQYVKEAGCFGIGAVGGSLDQICAEQDVKNVQIFNADPANIAAKKKHSIIKEFGTYLNYAIPVAEVIAVIASEMSKKPFIDNTMAGALLAQAGSLSARKVTAVMTVGPTKKHYNMVYIATPPAQWSRDVTPRNPSMYQVVTPARVGGDILV